MKKYLFVDTVCPKPYDKGTLEAEGLGGTEATVIRVAEKLGESAEVVVAQHCRHSSIGGGSNVTYTPLKTHYLDEKWDAVIALRTCLPLPVFRKKQPDTKLILWLHDLMTATFVPELQTLEWTQPTIVCVSKAHKTQVIETLRAIGCTKIPRMTVVYNPIADDLKPDATPVDKNKLVFFSSPHKGLDYALKTLAYARNLNPGFNLHVANPGYLATPDSVRSGADFGIVNVGVLPHHKAMEHVRSALCVFYPNHVFPETFGLVFAEANAVGTPVLTHPIGAAHEVLDHPCQMVDTRNTKVLIDRLMAWYNGARPVVRGKPQFRLSAVAREWRTVLMGRA
jgi:glycosyltransferase involved in cell wall biosynthesis